MTVGKERVILSSGPVQMFQLWHEKTCPSVGLFIWPQGAMTIEEALLQTGDNRFTCQFRLNLPAFRTFSSHLPPVNCSNTSANQTAGLCVAVCKLSQVMYDVTIIDYTSPSRLVSSSSSVIVAVYGFIRFIIFGDETNFMAL